MIHDVFPLPASYCMYTSSVVIIITFIVSYYAYYRKHRSSRNNLVSVFFVAFPSDIVRFPQKCKFQPICFKRFLGGLIFERNYLVILL